MGNTLHNKIPLGRTTLLGSRRWRGTMAVVGVAALALAVLALG